MSFQLILADPPWAHSDPANAGKRGAGHKYGLMTLDEIKSLPVRAMADKNCLLALWWVGPMPYQALQVVNAWGFSLKTMTGFVWHKTTKTGKSHFGMGNWTRQNPECCLFATIGKPIRISGSVRAYIEAPVREHSRKPDEIPGRLVELLGDVPRIELFARTRRMGWEAHGLETEKYHGM